MGDIGGTAQAAASITDTAMTDALNAFEANKNRTFSADEALKQRTFAAGQQQIGQNFSAQQAALNRSFQDAELRKTEAYNTLMSDTAIQRRSADIRAAGFNPLLSVGQLGGASSPQMAPPPGSMGGSGIASGAAASASALPNLVPLTQGLQGALTGQAQRDLLSSQKAGVDLDNQRKTAELPWSGPSAQAGYQQTVAATNQLMSQVRTLASQYDYNESSAAKLAQDKEFAAQLQPLLVQGQELENQRKKYGLPELQTQADFWKSPLAIGVYAGQQGKQIGVGGGWFTSALEVLRRGATQPSMGGPGDIGNPSP